jgi:hypothetical protein
MTDLVMYAGAIVVVVSPWNIAVLEGKFGVRSPLR